MVLLLYTVGSSLKILKEAQRYLRYQKYYVIFRHNDLLLFRTYSLELWSINEMDFKMQFLSLDLVALKCWMSGIVSHIYLVTYSSTVCSLVIFSKFLFEVIGKCVLQLRTFVNGWMIDEYAAICITHYTIQFSRWNTLNLIWNIMLLKLIIFYPVSWLVNDFNFSHQSRKTSSRVI